jgi:hypothetical protein
MALLGGCLEERANPPHYGAYLAAVLAGELDGRVSSGPPTGTDPSARASWLRTLMVGPDLKPDFSDGSAPPFCMALRWSVAQGAPKLNAADAGKLSISGHASARWVPWGVNPPPAPKALPTTIECTRGLHFATGMQVYGCTVDPQVGLAESWLPDTTELKVEVAGGAQIGAFEAKLKPVAPLRPEASFDLNQIDPTAVTAAWQSTSASLVAIEIYAQLVSASGTPSELAQIFCLEPAASRSKTIPAKALAVLPKPTGDSLLMLQTTLLGLEHRLTDEGWGSALVGAGRGTLGITCRTSSGVLCPP